MPNETNAVCAICGQKYYVCHACKSTKTLTPWRIIADTMDCYKIYTVLRHYTNGSMPKETAQRQLKKCVLPETFQPHIRSAIDEIMHTGQKAATHIPKTPRKTSKEK